MKINDTIKKINKWSNSPENFFIICIFFTLITFLIMVLIITTNGNSQSDIKYNVIKIEKVREVEKLNGNPFNKNVTYTSKFLVTYEDENGTVHVDEEVKNCQNVIKIGEKETYYQKGVNGVKLYISKKDYKKIVQINNNRINNRESDK